MICLPFVLVLTEYTRYSGLDINHADRDAVPSNHLNASEASEQLLTKVGVDLGSDRFRNPQWIVNLRRVVDYGKSVGMEIRGWCAGQRRVQPLCNRKNNAGLVLWDIISDEFQALQYDRDRASR